MPTAPSLLDRLLIRLLSRPAVREAVVGIITRDVRETNLAPRVVPGAVRASPPEVKISLDEGLVANVSAPRLRPFVHGRDLKMFIAGLDRRGA